MWYIIHTHTHTHTYIYIYNIYTHIIYVKTIYPKLVKITNLRKSENQLTQINCIFIHSVQFSHSVISDSFQPPGLQHTRLPCPLPTPRACSNLCPSSRWCHPTISSSAIPFFSCLQSFPASGSFPMSQFFTPGGQSVKASVLASVFPINIQDWFYTQATNNQKKN